MRCERAEFLISTSLDGERMTPAEARDLEGHLGGCPACRGVQAHYVERAALLEVSLQVDDEQGPLAERIVLAMRAAGPEQRSNWRPRQFRRLFAFALSPAFAASAAAAAALLVTAVWWLPDLRPGADSPGAMTAGESASPGFMLWQQRSTDGSVMSTEDGEPVGRQVSRSRVIMAPAGLQPAGGSSGDRVYFDIERVDTRFYQPVRWQ